MAQLPLGSRHLTVLAPSAPPPESERDDVIDRVQAYVISTWRVGRGEDGSAVVAWPPGTCE